ncbi:MAG: hypothetical protein J6T10_04675 [Methanobrevibacter sp.]|nr:hypothetical protein [Methanobrevibacter sp.]MBP5467819.1 hypothetical protein [Candidatus Riflebacteria bacterium]
MANNLTTNDGAIETGLRADVMRLSMENKNLLSNKDSIYVGTGDTTSVNVDGSTITIPTTKALEKGSDNTVLSVVGGNLGYNKVNPDLVQTGVTYNITSQTALNCENASRASFSYVADVAAYPAVGGEPSGETIETRFNNNTTAVSSLAQRVARIETMMNKGVDLLTSTSAYPFTVTVGGHQYEIGGIIFSKPNSVRYYNSCFLSGTILLGVMDEDNEKFDGFEAFYKNGEVATCSLNLNVDNKNYLPQQDVEFYINTDVKLRYDLKALTTSSLYGWFSIVMGQPLLLKIKTTGEITLEAKGLPDATKTSGSASMSLDAFEFGKYNPNISIPQPIMVPTIPVIKIYYLPKIND